MPTPVVDIDPSVRQVMNEIREHIRQWIVAVFERENFQPEVIPAELSLPRPNPPYITFKIASLNTKRGAVDEQIPLIDANPGGAPDIQSYKTRATREFTLSIQFFGLASEDWEQAISAMDMAMAVQNSIDLRSVKDFFSEKNLGIVNDNNIQDISELIDSETEPRAIYDVIMSARFETEDEAITFIESIEYQGDFDTNMDGTFNKSTGPVTVS